MIHGVLSIIHYSPCILFFVQHHPACENILYHNPKVIGRYKKRWSIVSPIPLHRMHQSRLKALNSLLNCSISLVFIFLCATNQARVMTLEGGSWFQQKFGNDKLNKAKKKILLRILLRKKVPKLSHMEQIETNVHGRVKSLVFQDPQSPHQLDPKTKRCHYLRWLRWIGF